MLPDDLLHADDLVLSWLKFISKVLIDPGEEQTVHGELREGFGTTACRRVKVKATSVCRGPDTGQKVSVRVRTTDDPKSVLTVPCCIHVSTDC